MRNFLINTGVLLGSLFTFFLMCELLVFRLILPATDIPQNAFIDGVIRFAPDQRGNMRFTDGKPVPFSINAQGWNSRHDAYQVERRPGVRRIAVIGDSYVEGLNVPYDQSFADHLDRQLNADGTGKKVEVYRFGISGAPLSQYLYMLQNEVARYKPDLVIVLMVHNDFDESFGFKAGRYTSSFLKLKMDGARVAEVVPPSPYKASALEVLRHSATFRYIYYQRKIRPTVLRDIILGNKKDKIYEANVEVDGILANWDQIEAATDYLFGSLKDAVKDQQADLILVMDANRQAIYENRPEANASGAGKLNQLAARLADARGIRFLDLETAFRDDWLQNSKRFEFPDDNHWNLRGHSEAAKAIAAFMDIPS